MNYPQTAEIVSFLNSKGFNLEESKPERFRFEQRKGDGFSEIEILISPVRIFVILKSDNDQRIYDANNFDELKSLLKDKVE